MYLYGTEPVVLLADHVDELPAGKALVLAAGEGRNAVFLAEHGFDVLAVDASAKGLEKARALASEKGVEIETEVRRPGELRPRARSSTRSSPTSTTTSRVCFPRS